MTFGSLFSGIGGIDLGLERADMRCVWQVEIDDYARAVLEKHWPAVPKWGDVRTFPPAEGDWACGLIAGGFPCQPVSLAGRRAGDADPRWLWPEFARVLGALRPRYAVLENVPGLLSAAGGKLFGGILGDLAALGYDAEWDCIPAAFAGARHFRARVFVVAASRVLDHTGAVAPRCFGESGRQGRRMSNVGIRHRIARGPWSGEPGVSRVVNGLPHRLVRCERLGNSVVPQIAEWIGRRILESHKEIKA